MQLEDFIYVMVKRNGSSYEIKRNNQFVNHYQYLNCLKKDVEEFAQSSFGLAFERDNHMAKVMTFQNLVEDGWIIFENVKMMSSDPISCFCCYLPSTISSPQREWIEEKMSEIFKIKNLFLENYKEELGDFVPLYQTIDDLKNGGFYLQYYVNENLEKTKERL